MPQLDKVTFYLQTLSVLWAFILYHFFSFRYVIKPLYVNLKMRETCWWWFDFDRDLIDYWLGEYQVFLKISFSFSLGLINYLNNCYLWAMILEYRFDFYDDRKFMLPFPSTYYFYKRLQRGNKVKSFFDKNLKKLISTK